MNVAAHGSHQPHQLRHDPQLAPGSLGAVIRRAREAADLTQFELGEHLHVSGRTMGRWERDAHGIPAGALPILQRVLRVRFVNDGEGRWSTLKLDQDAGAADAEPDLETDHHASSAPQVAVFYGDAAKAIYELMERLGIPHVPTD